MTNDLLPEKFRHLQRFSLPQAERALSERLGLSWDARMQHWEIVNANPDLSPRLLEVLAMGGLSDDELFSLMALTVASVDELFLLDGRVDQVWRPLASMLLGNPELYASIIWYWAYPLLRHQEPFPISAHMVGVWKRASRQLTGITVGA